MGRWLGGSVGRGRGRSATWGSTAGKKSRSFPELHSEHKEIPAQTKQPWALGSEHRSPPSLAQSHIAHVLCATGHCRSPLPTGRALLPYSGPGPAARLLLPGVFCRAASLGQPCPVGALLTGWGRRDWGTNESPGIGPGRTQDASGHEVFHLAPSSSALVTPFPLSRKVRR